MASGPSDRPLRVLCVDDEPVLLDILKRSLVPEFEVVTAKNGHAALEILGPSGPFAVVVSDLAMPGMSGGELLRHVQVAAPEVVSILLTGCSEVEAAATALNAGRVFRFVTKPCSPEKILQAVREAGAQYRVGMAERALLESTLQASIRMLTHVIGLLQPAAFGRSERLSGYVLHIAHAMKVRNPWRYEMAARLSQLGCITLPNEIVAKAYAGQALNEHEAELFAWHPFVAYELLAPIPRLEDVAEMVRRQNEPRDVAVDAAVVSDPRATGSLAPSDITLGARMLALALALDAEIASGRTLGAAIAALRERRAFDAPLLAALNGLEIARALGAHRLVSADDLTADMELDQDLRSEQGVLIVAKGQEVTPALMRRLSIMSDEGALPQRFRVRMRA